MNHARLEDWSVIGLGVDPYKPPEQRTIHLMGKVYGHPRYDDGDDVLTSIIMHTDGREVITLNTKYTLGKAHESYKRWFLKHSGKKLNEDNPFPD
jgi:hypothetical protein